MFPHNRTDALARLVEFEKTASRYSKDRNHVVPGHTNVSRLSPAIRHRLISETEVAKYVLHRYAFSTVEKFLQEVYWRRYWKSWLALRPQVWNQYVKDLEELQPNKEAQALMVREGGIEVMNTFVQELTETGYIHNHVRMWFAAYWIHTMKLPWQLGADFFYQHLLDADAASNTLSLRWVSGLQTPGKVYIARRSNIEKYLHPELLNGNERGLELLEGYNKVMPEHFVRPEVTANFVENDEVDSNLKTGFWMHEDDLSCESVLEQKLVSQVTRVVLTKDEKTSECVGFSGAKQSWLSKALNDAQFRLAKKFDQRVDRLQSKDLGASLIQWMQEHELKQLVAYSPAIGYLNDQLVSLKSDFSNHGLKLALLNREEDLQFRPLAKAGFFGFWKQAQVHVRALKNE